MRPSKSVHAQKLASTVVFQHSEMELFFSHNIFDFIANKETSLLLIGQNGATGGSYYVTDNTHF